MNIISIFAIININATQKASLWTKHTLKVIAQASIFKNIIIDLETSLRGYIITGDKEFLDPYIKSNKTWSTHLQNMKETVRDNPKQVQRLKKIENLLKNWLLKVSAPELKAVRANDLKSARKIVSQKIGKETIDKIRITINEFIKVEQELLNSRSLVESSNSQKTLWIIYSFIIISILFTLIFSIYYTKQYKKVSQKLLAKERVDAVTSMVTTYNHELNNILTISIGSLEVLKKHNSINDQDYKKFMDTQLRIKSIVDKINNAVENNDIHFESYSKTVKMMKLD